MSPSVMFPPADDASEREHNAYDAWYEAQESKRKDYDA